MTPTTRQLHPVVHRLMKEISFNPSNEPASIPSPLIQQQLFAIGRRQTSHTHQSSHRLGPPAPLSCHSPLPKLTQRSDLLGNLIPDAVFVVTYMVYVPPSGPLSAFTTRIRCLWAQRSHSVDSRRHHATVTSHIRIADWALGPRLFSRGHRPLWRMGGVAIAHRGRRERAPSFSLCSADRKNTLKLERRQSRDV
ncbi:uncharacterized protein LACBIDRAFT_335242 [Laccaria bicolor S238N-H82]|uniref:Predicted protein n=1 Tax=Laccaria bicolor (strain S238N-H82 / ATCC MYA-4686) TaxID=486041 RepID=B0E1S8_LACBS|nr:uncharacterized protein LACBIDRAFT_335242 [Laccaria bicolor S238N-H82]EDQ99190.1 predicted protein [Laccaria bicolor S238N-H82]|eukprot:XP_001890157.1 predicted protein [Laccaria bicolor S238N-H82]